MEAKTYHYPDLDALLKANFWRVKDEKGRCVFSKKELAKSGGVIQSTTKNQIRDLLENNKELLKGRLTLWVDGAQWMFINWTEGEATPEPRKLYATPAHTLVLQIILKLIPIKEILHGSL